jgi:DNA helicase-2/ATP-dependent DNA helicase PcrA
MELTSGLNLQQAKAVTASDGATLVLAGPGSGKTRVLTHRIAHLIGEGNVQPYEIISVTFTNKAAQEMKHRVEQLIGRISGSLRIGTFHALCARILRQEANALEYHNRNFVVYDTDDQLNALKRAVEEVGIDLKRLKLTPYNVLNAISDAKNELITPRDYPRAEYRDEALARFYERYQSILQSSNAMDFDDLIMSTVMLMRQNPALAERYQRYFRHVLVDEFQDTNMAQYELIRLWGKHSQNVFVVGDEDQAIYAFRGADYRNVARFRRDYPHATVILLEQNYRSTQNILDAARAVIDRNPDRTPKALFTDRGGGAKISMYEAFDENEEAEYIVKEVERLRHAGMSLNNMAIMYRTNVQSRVIEMVCSQFRIPYRIVGGVGFYQRREVKDMVAYLRLIDSDVDSVSFDRVINTPKRGIGGKTVATFQAWADQEGISYGEGLTRLLNGESVGLSKSITEKLASFGEMLAEWRGMAQEKRYAELLDDILERTRYDDYLIQESKNEEQVAERRENVAELRQLLAQAEFDTLSDFLTDASLSSERATNHPDDERITLLTLHASKGLEYAVVFLTGLEDRLLPHSRALDDPDEMAEERRLMYVGITRAKDRLYLTRAFRRRMGTYFEPCEPSRFLYDIPTHLIQGSSVATEATRQQTLYNRQGSGWNPTASFDKVIPFPSAERAVIKYRAGMRVYHAKFGEGTVIESKKTPDDEEVAVAFREVGVKRLMASFAKMEILSE